MAIALCSLAYLINGLTHTQCHSHAKQLALTLETSKPAWSCTLAGILVLVRYRKPIQSLIMELT